MPNRIVRDGILMSERVDALSDSAELFYRRLMSVVDDFGRYEASPRVLLAACYPIRSRSRVTEGDIQGWLTECSSGEDPLIIVYSVGRKTYLQLDSFRQRTRFKSKFPDPSEGKTVQRPSNDGLETDEVCLESDCGPSLDNNRHAPTRATNSPPNTNTPSHDEFLEKTTTPEVSPDTPEDFHADMFEKTMGIFISLGRGMTISDRMECENLWNALPPEERVEAYQFAIASLPEWQTRPTGKIAQPWNYLRDAHWKRAAPRLLPQTREPTRSQQANRGAFEILAKRRAERAEGSAGP